MNSRITRAQLQQLAETAAARSNDATRHKCFVSYHADDMDEVEAFVDDFGSEFIARTVGVTVEDDFIDSDDEDYIKRRIRELYMSDSTVTIVLLGQCTWARKFVDWEISSTLRDDTNNKRMGLLVYPLPSRNNTATLPARVRDNWNEDDKDQGYALYRKYPTTKARVRSDIQAAFDTRTERGDLVDNTRPLMKRNRSC